MIAKVSIWALLLVFFLPISSKAQNASGQFTGEVVAILADDGRNLVLKEQFGYIDSRGTSWPVPPGTMTDGASIPQVFWVAYPPFTGRYRRAAVIHDYYCQTKERTWMETHNVFYEAMLTAGVDRKTAKVMWAAVYYMGPRWGAGSKVRGYAAKAPKPTDVDAQKILLDKLEVWIAEEDPSQNEIMNAADIGVVP